MQRKHSPALRANIKASTSFPQSGTELGDIFICGTAKACSVKDCFKRSTHFHCSLCPDRKVVKEQNMVAHQIFHVTGRIEKRCVRDTHFDAYNGQCGRPLCRFSMNNKKHHHCKHCEWPCCGRKLQRCVSHIKSKHPDISLEGFGDMTVSMRSESPNRDLEDSLNSQETDTEDKEMVNVKAEYDDCEATAEGGYHDDKLSDAAEMIELRSMVWHHPMARKIPKENSGTENTEKVNGSHDESLVMEKCSVSPESKKSLTEPHPDTEQEESSFQERDEGKLEGWDESSSISQREAVGSTVPRYSGSSCKNNKCKEIKSHFHCHLCDFVAFKKILLERHRNIHARGFIEKRKKRDMYFNGSDAACGVIGCRFSVVKQRHHHCKLCGWACSSRKLQRCIKHIQDKHGVSVDSDPTDEKNFDAPRVIADPDALTASPTFHPGGMDDCRQESSMNGDVNESFDTDAEKMESENQSPDQFPVDLIATGEVPNEDELFFLSKADYRCMVDKCVLLGPHYHCNRCPYVTRQKHCRPRHRAIHLKGFPERRMIRDQHFTVFDGICGRTCRFSVPKRKHFHCKYCDWACCARKLPRILNHLSRKHSEVLKDTNLNGPSVGSKRPRGFQSRPVSEPGDEENKVIILEEEGSQCSFIIKDVHSLRESSANGEEQGNSVERKVQLEQNNHCDNQFEKVRDSPKSERGFKPYKPASYSYPHGYVNGHSSQAHPVERPLSCRVCSAYPSDNLSLQKMVVYSSSNRLELDLRLTSLLCTYFRVSIEEAFNNYICERDFEEWCNFHARKISVYPVIAIESTNIHHSHVVQTDEHYVNY